MNSRTPGTLYKTYLCWYDVSVYIKTILNFRSIIAKSSLNRLIYTNLGISGCIVYAESSRG